jgi:protein-tyrosine phosphatase
MKGSELRPVLLCTLFVLAAGCAQETEFQRSIPLEGQSNFRDIGGYKTADGQTVRTGIVFRSGELHGLTEKDVKTLSDLGIGTVVNFLIPTEIEARGADVLPAWTKEVFQPIESGDGLVAEAQQARRTGDFSKVPADLNPKLHELLVDEAQKQYAALIREIIAAEGEPLAYHCSHGIHRTGTATAIILSALGVPWESVRSDYLLSNETRAAEVGPRLEKLRLAAAETFGQDPADVDMTNIKAFYILEGSYIDGSLKRIEDGYGGIDGYLKQGLGLSDEEIKLLRERLLD